MNPPKAAYIHIPFCRAKCFYCDFNSYAGRELVFGDYVEALIAEISMASALGVKLQSVYIGGGTPTLLPPEDLGRILSAIDSRFGVEANSEITIEANPGTITLAALQDLRLRGFNRLSIGVQSFDDGTLERLGRIHTSEEARTAFLAGRSAGFDNISVDLMYALPEQSLADWRSTLDAAVELAPEHISLYELTVEEGTAFGNLKSRCQLELPDEDLQIEMYVAAINMLQAAGYEHYEISNFGLAGRRSRHNQVYWRNEPYYGFGAGACGFVNGLRYTNTELPESYIAAVSAGGTAVASSERVVGRQAMGETVMLGIRMLGGLDLAAFRDRFGIGIREAYAEELVALIGRGLIELSDTTLRLTWRGLLMANEVAHEFL